MLLLILEIAQNQRRKLLIARYQITNDIFGNVKSSELIFQFRPSGLNGCFAGGDFYKCVGNRFNCNINRVSIDVVPNTDAKEKPVVQRLNIHQLLFSCKGERSKITDVARDWATIGK